MMNDKFLKDYVQIIKRCNYNNTYKMGLAKALVEIAYTKAYRDTDGIVTISLESIATLMLKYYWNQTFYFNLIQGANLVKKPKMVTDVITLIEHFMRLKDSKQPVRYERAEVLLQHSKLLDQTVARLVSTIKQDVIWRFLKLDKDVYTFYTYNQNLNTIEIPTTYLKTLNDYAFMLFDLINYRWALILETFNSSPRIGKKVTITDSDTIPRTSLSKYFKTIALDNPHQVCFICDRPIDGKPSIDHVIPWSYMFSDDVWNLVFVHKSCNSSKSNRMPDEALIEKLETRNQKLKMVMEEKHINTKQYHELILAEKQNWVKKFWIGCQ